MIDIKIAYKNKLLDTFAAFDKFCKKYDIQYYSAYGTLIGAIRHKGLIPWDDDIDVFIMRSEYDKFVQLRSKLTETNYEICVPGDKNYHFAFSKFCDKTTTIVELPQFSDCVIGVYIDIFPLDEVSGAISEIQKKKNKFDDMYLKYQYSFWQVSLRSLCSHIYHRMFRELYFMIITKFMSGDKLSKLRNDFINHYAELGKEKGDIVLTYICNYGLNKELLKKEWFHETIKVDFEGMQIDAPIGYHEYLSQLYGNYMTPPPVEKQVTRHFHYYLNLKERLTKDEVKDRMKKGEKTVL